MSLTTSYFAAARNLEGSKISIARYNPPKIVGSLDEIQAVFAPSQELLRIYKADQIDWKEYTKIYTQEQRDHFRESPEDFAMLLQRASLEDITLLCYEKFEGKNTECHRMLLFDMLKKVARKEQIEVEFIKETTYKR